MNKKIQNLIEQKIWVYLVPLFIFAIISLLTKQFYVAAVQAFLILVFLIYHFILHKKKEKDFLSIMESLRKDTDLAKNFSLLNFPLPMVILALENDALVWGNRSFYEINKRVSKRVDARVQDFIPGFTAGWLRENENQSDALFEVDGRKFKAYGNKIARDKDDEDDRLLAICYFVDRTDFEDLNLEYNKSRPCVGYVTIDNYEELTKGLVDRRKNEIRDQIEELLIQWIESTQGILRRFEKDKYVFLFEKRYLERLKTADFPILDTVHKVEGRIGMHATISIGIGYGAENLSENLKLTSMASEMALSRGGDQAVLRDKNKFEFFGGKSSEIKTRSNIRSRVMAQALSELISQAEKVYVMGHKQPDMDAVGAAVAVCALARKLGKTAKIILNRNRTASELLIARLEEQEEYRGVLKSPEDALSRVNENTLLVVVDTNRPEQTIEPRIIDACNIVAVIDHHRRAETFIQKAALSFVEPIASSTCELMSEILEEQLETGDLYKFEAEAMLSGMIMDTKGFTLRTGERTFEAAAFLLRSGADILVVKRLLQNDIESTVSRYEILQSARLYRGNVAIAATETPHDRVIIAQAADELLNVLGIETSFVVCPGEDGDIMISGRSIGEIDVQHILETLGGGGNREAAAARIKGEEITKAVERLMDAIDDYLED